MSNLDEKLKELDLEFLHGVPVHLTSEMVEQIKQAFLDDGWERPRLEIVDMQERQVVVLHDGRFFTGREWHRRFVNELGKPTYMNDDDGRHAVYKIGWIGNAAKRAAGIEL